MPTKRDAARLDLRSRVLAMVEKVSTWSMDERCDILSEEEAKGVVMAVMEVVLAAAADHAETWGGLPPSPKGRRKQLAAEIRALADEPLTQGVVEDSTQS